MGLHFKCSKCNEIVFSKFLNIGEEYVHQKCGGKTIIPEEAESTETGNNLSQDNSIDGKIVQSKVKDKDINTETVENTPTSQKQYIAIGAVIVAIIIVVLLRFPNNFNSSSIKEIQEEWFQYSNPVLKEKLTNIMMTKLKNGKFQYKNHTNIKYVKNQVTYMQEYGDVASSIITKLVFMYNGKAVIATWAEYWGMQKYYMEGHGSWWVQWSPSPYSLSNNAILVNIGKTSDGMDWAPTIIPGGKKGFTLDEFWDKTELTKKHKQEFVAFGDSLREVFMNERNLFRGSGGFIKK